MSPTFTRMYAKVGRPSIPPEHLLKASLLTRRVLPIRTPPPIALYSVCSERQFCERLAYDMLFRWFLDLNIRGGSRAHEEPQRAGGGLGALADHGHR